MGSHPVAGDIDCIVTNSTNICATSSSVCNTCSACCDDYIYTGLPCDDCVKARCAKVPGGSVDKSRYYFGLVVAVLMPYLLRILQSVLGGKFREHVLNAFCCGSKDPLALAWTPDMRTNKVGLEAIADGDYNGFAGWKKACKELGWPTQVAVAVAALRLLFWHWMQPGVYFWVLYSFSNVIDPTQLKLGIAVAAREAIYVLLVTWGLITRPAFLLVNLDAKENTEFGVLGTKLLYVMAPEKFVAYAVVASGEALGKEDTLLLMDFLVIPGLDMCGVAALAVGAKHGDLPAALAVGYSATILSFVAFFGVLVDGTCGCKLVKKYDEKQERKREQQKEQNSTHGGGDASAHEGQYELMKS